MGYIGFVIHDRGHFCQLGGFSSGGFCQVVWSGQVVSVNGVLGLAIFLYPTPRLPPSCSLLAMVCEIIAVLHVLCFLIAFVIVINLASLLMPFSVPTSFSN